MHRARGNGGQAATFHGGRLLVELNVHVTVKDTDDLIKPGMPVGRYSPGQAAAARLYVFYMYMTRLWTGGGFAIQTEYRDIVMRLNHAVMVISLTQKYKNVANM